MKILICDDEIQYLNDLKKHIEEYMKTRFINFEIECSMNPNEIFTNQTVYNLAFLDIQMDNIDGISLAKELKRRNSKIVIFFVTSYNEYQDDAMDLRVFRFFEKPFNVERLYSGLDKAMEYINETYIDIYLQNGKTQTKILVDDISYIEHRNRKTYLNEVNAHHLVSGSVEDWANKLPHDFFYQVHKSFLVNLHFVNQYNYTELFLNDGTRIPIATRKQADFHRYWFLYLRRR